MSILLSHADILTTVDGRFETLKDAYLGIEGNTIVYIGKQRPETPFQKEKMMQGKLLMPGLVNAHGHSAMTLLRGLGSDLNLQEWLFDTMMPIEDRMDREDIEAGRSLAMLEMIASGTTMFSDMYMYPEDAVKLCGQAGLKGNFSRVMQCFDPKATYEENGRGPLNNSYFEAYNDSYDGRIKIDYMIHAEYTTFPEITRSYIADANKRNALIHTHISETKKEHEECKEKYGKTPIEWFNDLGAFEHPAYAAHCVWVEDGDLEIMKEKNVTCVHNPSSNMKIGSGFAPIVKMLDMGINVALGTDGAASNNNLNMFEEMHLASVIHNGYTLDPTVLPADTVLKMATVNGARALGRPDTGSLEVGKKADIIALDMDKPHLIPNIDTVPLIVYSAQGADVCMTMVDGKILYEGGEFLTLDKKEIYAKVERSLRKLYQ